MLLSHFFQPEDRTVWVRVVESDVKWHCAHIWFVLDVKMGQKDYGPRTLRGGLPAPSEPDLQVAGPCRGWSCQRVSPMSPQPERVRRSPLGGVAKVPTTPM